MSSPFGSLDEARMRVLAQWEYEGKLTSPLTLTALMAMHAEIVKHCPETPAVVFPWSEGGANG